MTERDQGPLRRDEIAGVILAGGASRRMGGGDKGLLPVDGQPMLARVIALLRPQVGPLILNANGDPDRFAVFGLPVVADASTEREGPLAGVLTGLMWASARRDLRAIVTVTSDTPFLPLDLVPRLSDAGALLSVAASAGRMHPTIGLWPLPIASEVAAALQRGDRKATAFVTGAQARRVEFPFVEVAGRSIDPFFNANTPEDLDAARALLQSFEP